MKMQKMLLNLNDNFCPFTAKIVLTIASNMIEFGRLLGIAFCDTILVTPKQVISANI